MQPHRENQAIKKPCGMRYDVEMTIGYRIKGTCVKGDSGHGFWEVGCFSEPQG